MDNLQVTLDWANRDIVSIIFGILIGILIFIIGRWIARLLSRLSVRAMERAEVDPLVIRFVKLLVYIGLLVAVVIAALDAAGIHTTSLTALLASAGLAIGLAVKDALSNFASGVMILITKPYTLNDYIEAANSAGTVEEVSIFSTVLRSPDNIRIIVPNAQVTGATIKNYSANDTRRIDLVAGIGYDDNIGQARDILLNMMSEHPLILADPLPTVEVMELADSSVNLAVRSWTKTENYWPARTELLEMMKARFDENDISMPYPQQEIFVRRLDALPG